MLHRSKLPMVPPTTCSLWHVVDKTSLIACILKKFLKSFHSSRLGKSFSSTSLERYGQYQVSFIARSNMSLLLPPRISSHIHLSLHPSSFSVLTCLLHWIHCVLSITVLGCYLSLSLALWICHALLYDFCSRPLTNFASLLLCVLVCLVTSWLILTTYWDYYLGIK